MNLAAAIPGSLASLLLLVSVLGPAVASAHSEATAFERTCPGPAAEPSMQAQPSPAVTTSDEVTGWHDSIEACASPAQMAEEPTAFEVTVEAGDLWFDARELVIPANGETTITLDNRGFVVHNLAVDDLELLVVAPRGRSEKVTIVDPAPGTYEFYCSISGHRQAGMVGTLTVQ